MVPSDLNKTTEIVGQCSIDTVNSSLVTGKPVLLNQPLLEASGWAAISASDGIAADEIFLILTDEDGKMQAAKAKKMPRPDVNAYFNKPELGEVGFSAFLELPVLQKSATLRIAESHNGQVRFCPAVVQLNPVSP